MNNPTNYDFEFIVCFLVVVGLINLYYLVKGILRAEKATADSLLNKSKD